MSLFVTNTSTINKDVNTNDNVSVNIFIFVNVNGNINSNNNVNITSNINKLINKFLISTIKSNINNKNQRGVCHMSARVIAVSSNKGGVLKTSVTTNLAGVLANRGKRILIVDMDPQSNVALTFGINPDEFDEKVKHTIFDLLIADEPIEPTTAIVTVDKNIDLMATNDDMIAFEFTVLENLQKFSIEKRFLLLKGIIDPLRELYDFIFIDTPPNLGLTQGNVLAATDGLIIPFQPETYSMRSLLKSIRVFTEFKEEINGNLEVIGIVPTMVKENTMIHRNIIVMLREYGQINGIKIARNHIPNSIQYASSVGYEERPITIAKPKDRLAKVYIDLERELNLLGGYRGVKAAEKSTF